MTLTIFWTIAILTVLGAALLRRIRELMMWKRNCQVQTVADAARLAVVPLHRLVSSQTISASVSVLSEETLSCRKLQLFWVVRWL